MYEFPQIPAGSIAVTVQAAGFAAQQRAAFALVVNQVAKVDFALAVGKVSETISVNAAPPLLQTSSTEVGTVLNAEDVDGAAAGDAGCEPADAAGAGGGEPEHFRV